MKKNKDLKRIVRSVCMCGRCKHQMKCVWGYGKAEASVFGCDGGRVAEVAVSVCRRLAHMPFDKAMKVIYEIAKEADDGQ